jgi:hypothetical protein
MCGFEASAATYFGMLISCYATTTKQTAIQRPRKLQLISGVLRAVRAEML